MGGKSILRDVLQSRYLKHFLKSLAVSIPLSLEAEQLSALGIS